MVLDVHRIDTRPEPGLRRIGCMVGARSGSARPLANAESLDQRLPTSHLVIIDAGHFVWQEAPTEYASIVIDSLTGNRS
jgi:pimeloyl-ACP methyl ester carboxylesterase